MQRTSEDYSIVCEETGTIIPLANARIVRTGGMDLDELSDFDIACYAARHGEQIRVNSIGQFLIDQFATAPSATDRAILGNDTARRFAAIAPMPPGRINTDALA